MFNVLKRYLLIFFIFIFLLSFLSCSKQNEKKKIKIDKKSLNFNFNKYMNFFESYVIIFEQKKIDENDKIFELEKMIDNNVELLKSFIEELKSKKKDDRKKILIVLKDNDYFIKFLKYSNIFSSKMIISDFIKALKDCELKKGK